MCLAAARALGIAPADVAVFQDALAGAAGAGQAGELQAHGADVVVADPVGLLEAS